MAWLEDPTVFLTDFGVAISSGGTTGLGILDMPGSLTADGMAITTDYTVRCETSKFGGLLYGDEMTVGGITYQVREVRLVDDGTFVEISLMRLDSGTAAVGRDPREGLRLSDLTDVNVTSPATGDMLVYDTDEWVNTPEVDGGGP